MRIAFTGGGTGGHVYPALEALRRIQSDGTEVKYFGSLRGQEADACAKLGVEFEGFASEPLYRIASPSGIRAGVRFLQASMRARESLRRWKPSALFSTGGYSAAPIVKAARSLRIPYVLFEANSAPGRSNLMFARQAASIAVVFEAAAAHFPPRLVVRTGMPIRRELRAAASKFHRSGQSVLALGGSQGSVFLNDLMPKVADLLGPNVEMTHVAGKAHELIARERSQFGTSPHYRCVPFLDGNAIAEAYASCSVVVGRSGSSVAEFAAFRLPSVLIPLPSAAADHQTLNAVEFSRMNAATLVPQSEATPERVSQAILGWLNDPDRISAAGVALADFDRPDAGDRIATLLYAAARTPR